MRVSSRSVLGIHLLPRVLIMAGREGRPCENLVRFSELIFILLPDFQNSPTPSSAFLASCKALFWAFCVAISVRDSEMRSFDVSQNESFSGKSFLFCGWGQSVSFRYDACEGACYCLWEEKRVVWIFEEEEEEEEEEEVYLLCSRLDDLSSESDGSCLIFRWDISSFR